MTTFIDSNDLPESIYNGLQLTEEEVNHFDSNFENSDVKLLVEVEDGFGSDYIVRFENKLILTDRNCGMYVYVSESDYQDLINDINSYLRTKLDEHKQT